MKSKIRILSDKEGQVTATVDINGSEYTVQTCSIGIPTSRRNEILRDMADKQAEARNENDNS